MEATSFQSLGLNDAAEEKFLEEHKCLLPFK
jgi:hypothetical protein